MGGDYPGDGRNSHWRSTSSRSRLNSAAQIHIHFHTLHSAFRIPTAALPYRSLHPGVEPAQNAA